MKSGWVPFLAFILFDVAAVAFAVWQWWTVRPREDKLADLPRSDESPGHPER